MESEMESIQPGLKAVELSGTENERSLTVACRLIKRLVENAEVVRCMHENHQEILSEFYFIPAADALHPSRSSPPGA
jgi:hypothetical protein